MHACINASTQTHWNRQICKINKKRDIQKDPTGKKKRYTFTKQKDKHKNERNSTFLTSHLCIKQFHSKQNEEMNAPCNLWRSNHNGKLHIHTEQLMAYWWNHSNINDYFEQEIHTKNEMKWNLYCRKKRAQLFMKDLHARFEQN